MAYERKFKVTKSIKDIVREYKKFHLGTELSDSTIREVLYELNKTISDIIIRESFEYKIPFKLGFIRIKKNKVQLKLKNGRIDVTRNMINWKATLDYWESKYGTRDKKKLKKIEGKQLIFQTNEHTDGDTMKWYWDKHFANTVNKTVYLFDAVKGGRQGDKLIGRHGLRDWIRSDEKRNDYYF